MSRPGTDPGMDPPGPLDRLLDEDPADLYENAPMGYLSTLPDGRIVKVNRTFCTWTGRAAEDVLGLRFRDLLTVGGKVFHDTHLAPLLRLLRESAAFAAAGAVSVVYLRAPVLLGPAFLTATELGLFAIAFRAVEQLTLLPGILTGALFPVLTHAALHDRDRLSRGYDLLWRSTAALGAFAAAARPIPSTRRVSAGSITPSSQSRAVE